MRAQDGAGAILLNTNKCNKTMRQYKESEWREEVEDIERADDLPKDLEVLSLGLNLTRATTRGAILYFYFNSPADCQTDRYYIMSTRRRLKAIRKERRKRVITKIRQWRKSITTRIYRWQLQCEYKRIMRHDKPNNTIEQ